MTKKRKREINQVKIQKMDVRKVLFLILTVVIVLAGKLQAQVFPVNVQGQLIPPNSLKYGDYFETRGNDVIYTVTLNDPERETVQVRYRLTIRNNNSVVLFTKKQLNSDIITLERGIPEMVTGNDLTFLFNNLKARQSQSIPEFLPEGLNGICLQIIDVQTGAIISNRGCAQGFFNFAQPPRLQSPVCDVEIQQTETQNILFNWLPLHNASGNPINSVQYNFSIVEIGPGVQNPKDAFDAGAYHYQTTLLNTNSFIYSDAEPILEQGKSYAWRVRAIALDDMGDSQPLFANSGFSEICTFSYA